MKYILVSNESYNISDNGEFSDLICFIFLKYGNFMFEKA